MSDWVRDTAVRRLDGERFAADVSDRWMGLSRRPLGGYVLALVLRAVQESVAFPDLLVVSAYFLRPTAPGPVEVHVEPVRTGRTVATAQASLFQDGSENLRLLATFHDQAKAEGETRLFAAPPDLPAPQDAVDLLAPGPLPGATVTERVDFRFPRTPGWRTGVPSGDPCADLWVRVRDAPADDLLTLPFVVDAAAPAVVELGAKGTITLELTLHVRGRPATPWLACRVRTRAVAGGQAEEDFEVWDAAGTLVAQSRQLAIIRR